jgi:hypothetical protein
MFVHFFEKCPFAWIKLDFFGDEICSVVNICRKKRPKKCLIQPFWPIIQGNFHISMWMQVINNQVMSYPFVTSKSWELGYEFKCITISTVVSPKEIFPYSFFIFLSRSCKKKKKGLMLRDFVHYKNLEKFGVSNSVFIQLLC